MTTTFTVGLVQMRSGLTPAANLDTAVKLIGDAKAAGADYVQTPEMTNIVANKRDVMLAATAEEEADVSLAAFRTLARQLGIHLHIGSLAIKISPERAANRSFLIDPQERSKMIERANGRTTVPQIFVGSTHIGGCDDLYALHRSGGLDPLLAEEGITQGGSA